MAKNNKQTIGSGASTQLTNTEERSLIRITSDAACYVGHGSASAATGYPVDSTTSLVLRVMAPGLFVFATSGCNINWIIVDEYF